MAVQASKQDMPGLPGAAPVDDIVMPFEAEGLEVVWADRETAEPTDKSIRKDQTAPQASTALT